MNSGYSARIGIDLGGTKIAGIALGASDVVLAETRKLTPQGDYKATITTIAGIVATLSQQAAGPYSIGIGIPGSQSPVDRRIQNANSTWLNGQRFQDDLERALDQPVRLANDANCFALSEATDGNAADGKTVFGVILGTGCGGGIVVDGRIVDGPRGIGGEWGHNPLPSPQPSEIPGPPCWCGRNGCMETWVSGPAVAADHARENGDGTPQLTAEEIAALAETGPAAAQATITRLADRLARGLAAVTNILDPDVIVLGGGLSSIAALYETVPELMRPHIFADHTDIDIRPPKWGPASGVRGAARLWPAG
ncbi:MAG: ROK family protein [Methyloligellaceae bacterium]